MSELMMEKAFAVLDEAREQHDPRRYFALFSGGHDSLSATAVAFEWARTRALKMEAVHIRTGTGIKETTDFVRDTCADQGWPLRIYEPPVPYEDIVMAYGFPGPGNHGLMYQRLKERCLRALIREAKQEVIDAGEAEPRERQRLRIGLVTGVRSEESVRRMRHVERIQVEGGKLWMAAIWNWTKADCVAEIARLGLRRNPVVDMLHMSGECLCGAFARPGEIAEIEMWFPEKAASSSSRSAQPTHIGPAGGASGKSDACSRWTRGGRVPHTQPRNPAAATRASSSWISAEAEELAA